MRKCFIGTRSTAIMRSRVSCRSGHGASWVSRAIKRPLERTSETTDITIPAPSDSNASSSPSVDSPTPLLSLSQLLLQPDVIAASTLVAGTAVGAGLLALPKSTLAAGFLPSTGALLGGYIFNVISGLLLAEVAMATMKETGTDSVSKATMVQRTLGLTGSVLASLIYVLHNYMLLVAYISKGGSSIASFLPVPDAPELGAAAFVLGLTSLCYFLPEDKVDGLNNVLVALLVASFLALSAFVSPGVDPHNLVSTFSPAEVVPALPTVALAFVYQNVVPIICASLGGDKPKIRTALAAGSTLPLVMFVLWELVVLGSTALPPGADVSTIDPIALLQERNGPLFSSISSCFALFAVATSFIGFVLGLSSFFRDTWGELQREKDRTTSPTSTSTSAPFKNPLFFLLATLPPFAVVSIGFDEQLFFEAVHLGGTFGVMFLFGILPPLMVLKVRERPDVRDSLSLVGSNPLPLAFVGLAGLYVMGNGIVDSITGLGAR